MHSLGQILVDACDPSNAEEAFDQLIQLKNKPETGIERAIKAIDDLVRLQATDKTRWHDPRSLQRSSSSMDHVRRQLCAATCKDASSLHQLALFARCINRRGGVGGCKTVDCIYECKEVYTGVVRV